MMSPKPCYNIGVRHAGLFKVIRISYILGWNKRNVGEII